MTAKGLKFNKVMMVSELVTQYRIAEITLKNKTTDNNKITKKDREDAFFSQLQSMPVNLFLTRMFYKTSFISWRNYMRKVIRRQKWEKEVEENRAFCRRFNKDFIEPVFPEQEPDLTDVDIEKEIILELSLSEGEEVDPSNDTKSRKSGTTYKAYS